MRAFGDESHVHIVDDGHFGVVGELEGLRGEDFGGRAAGEDASVQADDPGQMGGDGVDFVGGHDDGDALVVQLVEEVEELVAGLDVDADGGFVEEEQGWVADEGAGEKDALLLAAGEFTDVSLAQVVDAEALQHAADEFLVLATVPRIERVGHGEAHDDGLFHGDGEVPVDGLELGNVADAGSAVGSGEALDEDLALV